jgi:hypothetical protein
MLFAFREGGIAEVAAKLTKKPLPKTARGRSWPSLKGGKAPVPFLNYGPDPDEARGAVSKDTLRTASRPNSAVCRAPTVYFRAALSKIRIGAVSTAPAAEPIT